jgi:sec-independent protein translocase protein TatC
VLFLVGAAFGYFLLLPTAIDVLIGVDAWLGYESRPSVGSYFSLLIRTLVGVGGAFEFPLVIVLLSWLGLVTSSFLRRHRRHAIVAIFTLSAVITPSWDPLVQCLMAAPLYVLFELGIAVAARLEKRRERSAAAVIVALLALWPRKRPAVGSARLA